MKRKHFKSEPCGSSITKDTLIIPYSIWINYKTVKLKSSATKLNFIDSYIGIEAIHF